VGFVLDGFAMRRRFSIATLFLVTTMAAVSFATMRGFIVRVVEGAPISVLAPMLLGALTGFVYGTALSIWNRNTWMSYLALPIAGLLFGTAAGAQMSVRVGWPVMVLAPLFVWSVAGLVRFNRGGRPRVAVAQLSRSPFEN
jgi:hypothetical protein